MGELPTAYGGMLYVDLASIATTFAPQIFEAIGSSSDNPILECIAGGVGTDDDTSSDANGDAQSSWVASAACSVISGILGGIDGLQDLIVNRVPGPLAAVGYQQDNVQHVSGILLIGSND
jgi:hypothetical protein